MELLPDDYGTPEHEARWMRVKLGLSPDASTGDVQGQMHIWDSRQHGYTAYIVSHKCEDKQGEIARLSARVRELELLIQKPCVHELAKQYLESA